MRSSRLLILSLSVVVLLVPALLSCGDDAPSSPQEPVCELTPPSLDFGSVTLGRTKDLSFTIRNVGGGVLAGFASESCPAYSVESGDGSFGLPAGQSRTVTVRFAPSSAGQQTCTIGFGDGSSGSLPCTGTGVTDTDPPAAVTDLACSDPGAGSLRLTWTAVGDDGITGTAAAYDLRYSLSPITEENWIMATQCQGEPTPQAAGRPESFTVVGLQPSSHYYFRLKVGDEAPNWGELSNATDGSTLFGGPVPPGFVRIPAGTFIMGSPESEPGRQADENRLQVTLTLARDVCDHEVTQSEWRAMMGWNDSAFPGDNRPVDQVTWYDCIVYCNKRSAIEGLDSVYVIPWRVGSGKHVFSADSIGCDWGKNGYRLLTEAEWEYVCRAGSQTAYCNGPITVLDCGSDPNLSQVGWYCGNSSLATHEVKTRQANAWGLFDMHGNVAEWCWDWLGYYANAPVIDPHGPASSAWGRVVRGGGWSRRAQNCRSAFRIDYSPGSATSGLGLRVSRAAQ